jgi:hypothetical protein
MKKSRQAIWLRNEAMLPKVQRSGRSEARRLELLALMTNQQLFDDYGIFFLKKATVNSFVRRITNPSWHT